MGESQTVYLRSTLRVEECLTHIREATDAPKLEFLFPFGSGGSKPIFAKVRGNRISLWKRRETRNDFGPCFFGILSSEASGSQLVGHFGLNRSIRLFMAFWFTFSVGITLATLPALVDHLKHARQGGLSVFDFFPLGLVISGILLLKVGSRIGKQEEAFLLEFLQTTLQARQEDPRLLSLCGIREESPFKRTQR